MARHKLGKEIIRLLKERQRDQSWLAERLNLNRSTVNKWLVEDGNRISAEMLQAICDRLGVDNNVLFILAIEQWKTYKGEYEPYLKIQKPQTQTTEIQQTQTIHLPHIPELTSKDCPIYFELKLGKEVIERPDPNERDKPIFEWPGWHERGEDWRKRFEENPAHTVLNQWLNQPGIHVVIGEPGGGKSTLLRYWANELIKKSNETKQYVPILIPLREVKEDGIKGFF